MLFRGGSRCCARLIDARMLIALAIAAGVGTGGLRAFPIAERPGVSRGHRGQATRRVLARSSYGYAALWFSTPFWVAS